MVEVEQRHRAWRTDRHRAQTLRMKIQETMREVTTAGEAEEGKTIPFDPVAVADFVDHREQHGVVMQTSGAQELVARQLLRPRDARGEQRRQDDRPLALGEISEGVAIRHEVTAGAVDGDQ